MRGEDRQYLHLLLSILIALGGWLSAAQGRESPPNAGKQVKAGLIHVGPIGDYGWTNAHEQARQALVKKFPWLTTTYVESVPEADAGRVIDRLITEENCDVVFTTSFGYMNDTVAAAQRYPDKIFAHCSGYKQAKNLATYFAELYQAYYLNGLMAGALTKSHKVGYVGAHPIPEVVRHINAYALGVREVNPQAQVHVKWLYSWYDPAKCREAAEALVAEGCDALAFTEDSPAVIQVGEEHTAKGRPVYTFSHCSPMGRFGPNSAVSGQLVDWTGLYEMLLTSIREGRFEGTLRLGPAVWLASGRGRLRPDRRERERSAETFEHCHGAGPRHHLHAVGARLLLGGGMFGPRLEPDPGNA